MTLLQQPLPSNRRTLSPFEARFVSYVNITLTFEALRLAKRSRIRTQRQVLLVDNADRRADIQRFLVSTGLDDDISAIEERLEDAISEEWLQQAIRLLTPVQREVLNRLIVLGQAEQEVAQCLRISQQAVNKSKNNALAKLRAFSSLVPERRIT